MALKSKFIIEKGCFVKVHNNNIIFPRIRVMALHIKFLILYRYTYLCMYLFETTTHESCNEESIMGVRETTTSGCAISFEIGHLSIKYKGNMQIFVIRR